MQRGVRSLEPGAWLSTSPWGPRERLPGHRPAPASPAPGEERIDGMTPAAEALAPSSRPKCHATRPNRGAPVAA